MTAWTIRLALVGYVIAAAALLAGRRDERAWRLHRLAWTAGCLLVWAHLAAAFHFHHQWSHAHAAAETTRRTVEVVGWSWGGEIYFNYLFAAIWTGDALAQWIAPHAHRRRPAILAASVHGFLFFVIFNATIVFEEGPTRIAAVLACVLLATIFVYRLTGRRAAGAAIDDARQC